MEQVNLTKEQFDLIKEKQLKELGELEREALALIGWIKEFEHLLNESSNPNDIIQWSIENDIEKEFKHIELH